MIILKEIPMKSKTVFCCSECGYETAKFLGKCPSCGEWNTLKEQKVFKDEKKSSLSRETSVRPMTLSEIKTDMSERITMDIAELDRVLGGGLVKGSLVLVGGEPGIGKSTLLMQVCQNVSCKGKILYVSGEESEMQLKMRAERLSVTGDDLLILPETDIDKALSFVDETECDVCIIDSVQTMFSESVDSSGGSVGQIRDVTMKIMRKAKESGCAFFIVGHVTKDGNIAGPRMLEHMVDAVLYFEGDRNQSYRILRGVKNRFGSTNEVGVFEMTGEGLISVDNPSAALLSGRPIDASGSSVTCLMEGTRPILAEIQALTSPTGFGMPRRAAEGVDFSRVVMLIAIIEKKLGLTMQNQDAYLNVVGGLKVDETAADLAIISAIISSLKNKSIDPATVFLGEVGLSGEVRSVPGISRRVSEAERLGFKTCVVPEGSIQSLRDVNIKLIGAKTVMDILKEDIWG